MATGPGLLHVKNLRLALGGAPLFAGVDFALHRGERACLVGANGAGKSTLMRIIAGLAEPDAGEIALANGVTLALTAQEPDLAGFATLLDYATSPASPHAAPAPAHEAEAALIQFGLDPEMATTRLSGGEARRAALARSFAAAPDILLLDEPTNHLDIVAIETLEGMLARFRGACLVISHDRRFLERVSTASLWLRHGRVLKLEQGYGAFEAWAERIEAEDARERARLETHLKAEEHWLRRGVTARRSRNEGRRRKLEALRVERREAFARANGPTATLSAQSAGDGARILIEAREIKKAYGDRVLIKPLSLRIMRGDRVGIVGPNGAGKTTMLEILLKRSPPDQGEVRHGPNLSIAYVDQTRADMMEGQTLWASLAPDGGDQVMVRGHPKHVAAYAKDFLFGPEQLRQPVSALSGGERNRLALAIALAKPADLIVLDEPTNDLDMDTLDALEDMLAGYDGTVLIVSHDRAFLDGVTTEILGAIGNGRWVETPGGWTDFEREHGGFAGPARAAASKFGRAPEPPRERKAARKLSFKDEHRLTALETLLPKLEAELAALDAKFADAGAFARDPSGYEAAAKRLAAARAEKDAAEEEWLDIEARREALTRQES